MMSLNFEKVHSIIRDILQNCKKHMCQLKYYQLRNLDIVTQTNWKFKKKPQ